MSSIEYNDLKTQKSIVNQQQLDSIAFARDKDEPYTFREWTEASGVSSAAEPIYKDIYSNYLSEWSKIKSQPASDSKSNPRDLFKIFLKQLPVDASEDELRYINNINYEDKHEIETAINFFSKHLKETTSKISDNREKIKYKTAKNSINGSNTGVPIIVRDYVVELLRDDTVITNQMLSSSDRDNIIHQLEVNVNELYDSASFDSNNLSESDRVTLTGTVNQQIDYDPYLFIDETISTQNLLAKYGNALSTTTTTIQTNNQQEITLDFQPDISTVSDLPDSEFISYDKQELNLNNIKEIIKLSSGTLTSYLSSDSLKNYTTGDLFDSSNNTGKYKTSSPGITFSEDVNPISKQKLGSFYTPSKLGVIDYYSYNAKPIILDQYIEPNKLYVYESIENHGSNKYDLPVDYKEDFTFLKNNTIESGQPGEITSNINNLPKFNNYQSKEQSNLFSTTGVSRQDDNYDFWTGDVDSIWSNSDVYENIVPNTLEIDARQQSMLSNAGYVYEWKSDSYGNEYSLLKKIKNFAGLTQENFNPPAPVERCGIMDGDMFIDPSAQVERNCLLSSGARQNIANPMWESITNGSVNSGCVFSNDSAFNTDSFSRVADGRTFFDTECVFDEPETESIVIDVPKPRPGTTYCNFYDGYIMQYQGVYEIHSSNTGTWSKSKVPVVSELWDCGDFNTVCVPAPITATYYKTADSYITGSTFVETELESADASPVIPLHEQSILPGELFMRFNDSSKIGKFVNLCENIVNRYSTTNVTGESIDVSAEIRLHLLDFSVVGDILIFKTEKLLVFDRIKHNYETNKITPITNPIILARESQLTDYQLSEYFYNEHKNEIILCSINTSPFSSTTGEEFIENRLEMKLYCIDTRYFILKTHTPEIVWHEPDADILLKSVINIAQPHVTHNLQTDKYYAIFLCNYNTPGSEKTAAIGQVVIDNITSSQYAFTLYTSGTPAKGSLENLSRFDRRVVSTSRVLVTDNMISDPPSTEFKNSIKNKLELDLSSFMLNEIATLVEVYFDYDNNPNSQPDYTRTRKPVRVYDGFDTGKILGDSRDPRMHLVEHVYNDTNEHMCKIRVHTVEKIKNPTGTDNKIITWHEINLTVYGDETADITTMFGPTSGTGASIERLPGLGVEIHNATAFSNDYGVEHILLMIKTINPDYLSPVMLRLAEPIREQMSYTIIGDNDSITRESLIDTSTIDITYGRETLSLIHI